MRPIDIEPAKAKFVLPDAHGTANIPGEHFRRINLIDADQRANTQIAYF
jgi:hypothetical protein